VFYDNLSDIKNTGRLIMARFQLGGIYLTRGVAELSKESPAFTAHIQQALARYSTGDWGDMCAEDKASNDKAIKCPDGGRVFAAYKHPDHEGWKIWIITEADRSATTVLFPDEY
jgi:hypothetical protein